VTGVQTCALPIWGESMKATVEETIAPYYQASQATDLPEVSGRTFTVNWGRLLVGLWIAVVTAAILGGMVTLFSHI